MGNLIAAANMSTDKDNTISWDTVLSLVEAGQWTEVISICEGFLGHSEFGETAVQLQAEAHLELGEPEVAIEKLQPLLQSGNVAVLTLQLLARALEDQGLLVKAKELLDMALSVDQANVQVWLQLGVLYVKWGDQAEAVRCFKRVVELKPDEVEAWNSLGAAQANQLIFADALDSFSRAAELDPDHYLARVNRLFILNRIARFEGILEEVDRLLLMRDSEDVRQVGALVAQQCCDWDAFKRHFGVLDKMTGEAIAEGRCPREQAVAGVSFSNDPQRNKRLTHAWARLAQESVATLHSGFEHRAQLGEPKIRIGYISSDFRLHPITQQTLPLYGLHDRELFEVFVYSTGRDDGSEMRQRVARESDHFIDLRQTGTLDAAQKIFDDKIDVLVDFSGHTEAGRMEICALRPAPIQAAMLSATGTNGGEFYDYVITDPVVLPEESMDDYSEMPAWLAGSFFLNHREESISQKKCERADYGLPQDAFVFGSFNQSYKITQEVFAVWMRLLKEVPGSVLWMSPAPEMAEQNLRDFAVKEGVNSDRLIFAELEPRKDDHLRRLQLVDLGLDTLVFNGQTTTKDLLWAGVPVVAYYGSHFSSRVSASLLWALGMNDHLVARSIEGYEKMALTLARDAEQLLAVREKLDGARFSSSLFDMPRMVRQMEGLYAEMVRRHNADEGVGRLAVDEAGVIVPVG